MAKYIELTMVSGAKYFLISTEDNKYSDQKVNYLLRGSGTASVKVNTENDLNSSQVYINPNLIESFKVVF